MSVDCELPNEPNCCNSHLSWAHQGPFAVGGTTFSPALDPSSLRIRIGAWRQLSPPLSAQEHAPDYLKCASAFAVASHSELRHVCRGLESKAQALTSEPGC